MVRRAARFRPCSHDLDAKTLIGPRPGRLERRMDRPQSEASAATSPATSAGGGVSGTADRAQPVAGLRGGRHRSEGCARSARRNAWSLRPGRRPPSTRTLEHRYGFTETQALAVMDLQFRRMTAMDRQKIEQLRHGLAARVRGSAGTRRRLRPLLGECQLIGMDAEERTARRSRIEWLRSASSNKILRSTQPRCMRGLQTGLYSVAHRFVLVDLASVRRTRASWRELDFHPSRSFETRLRNSQGDLVQGVVEMGRLSAHEPAGSLAATVLRCLSSFRARPPQRNARSCRCSCACPPSVPTNRQSGAGQRIGCAKEGSCCDSER